MSNKVITLRLSCLLLLLNGACSDTATSTHGGRASQPPPQTSSATTERTLATDSRDYDPPVHVANLENRNIAESSGLVASRLNPGVYWTHNDSSDGPFIYAFERSGKSKGVWKVTGAGALDWEDIAAGPGPVPETSYLYIGDIGDNDRDRKVITVYRVAEPEVESLAGSNSLAGALQTAPAEAILLQFPDGQHNAEALLVHPRTGDLYVITKTKSASCKVYKATPPFDTSKIVQLNFVSDLRLPGVVRGGQVTGADISPDGQRIVLCDYFSAYETSLPNADSDFDRIWTQPLARIELGYRQQGEAVCYRPDGQAILATSEAVPSPLIEALRKK